MRGRIDGTVAVVYLISRHGLQHKVQIMTGTEPLNKDGSPPHREARIVKLEMEDKMVQIIIKKQNIKTYLSSLAGACKFVLCVSFSFCLRILDFEQPYQITFSQLT